MTDDDDDDDKDVDNDDIEEQQTLVQFSGRHKQGLH